MASTTAPQLLSPELYQQLLLQSNASRDSHIARQDSSPFLFAYDDILKVPKPNVKREVALPANKAPDIHVSVPQSPIIAKVDGGTLERLGPELQREILLQADTPHEIYTLIQASPRLLHVFLLNKEYVLSTVARRQFHTAVLPEALAFAKLSHLERPLPRDAATEFCCNDPVTLHDMRDEIIPLTDSIILCKLAHNMRFFIQDFSRNTIPLMNELGHALATTTEVKFQYWPAKVVSHSELTIHEIGRLQRAFCRFEIYRCLFATCFPDLDHDLQDCSWEATIGPAEQANLYLSKYPDFQIVEINCIRDYLYRRLRGILADLEDEAVNTLPPETFIFDPEEDAEIAQCESGVYLFTTLGKYYQHAHIEHLMSLGLPYIRLIFESNGEERKDLFIRRVCGGRTQHTAERQFITTAFGLLGRNPAKKEIHYLAKTDPPFEYPLNNYAMLDIPDGWRWAHSRGPPHRLMDGSTKGFRDWGYVFWDFDRLRDSGILQQDRDQVRKIEYREAYAQFEPSVQERLLGSEKDPSSEESSDSEA